MCLNFINICGAEIFFLLPGLCDILQFASAVDPLHVSCADLGGTNSHEIRSRTADGELCEVGQRLANSCSEQEGSHYFVECSYILVEVRIRVNPLAVNQISLSRGDLKEEGEQGKEIFEGLFQFSQIFHFIGIKLLFLLTHLHFYSLKPFCNGANSTGCCKMTEVLQTFHDFGFTEVTCNKAP